MSNSGRQLRLLACWFALCGCAEEPLLVENLCDPIAEGDLVITEIGANPTGRDGTGEYIEVYNARAVSLPLDGVSLVAGRSDGTALESHWLADVTIDAGDYLVFGNAPNDDLPDEIDYSYGRDLGSLRNSEGAVSLWCGGRLIDQVTYLETTDGHALQLGGATTPDATRNDVATHWCTPSPGSPGRPNDECPITAEQGECADGAGLREIESPRPGQVQITEWMANPDGLDSDLEWVEITFGADADLNRFELGPATEMLRPVHDEEDCFRVEAGSRVVFGASPAAAPRVDLNLGFSLGNSGERRIVAAVEGEVVDDVRYEGTSEGIAWQIDVEGVQCLSAPGGTPGEPNERCPPALTDGYCLERGLARPIVHPAAGEVRITEWMANPTAVSNRDGEWLELAFDATADLNGVDISDRSSSFTVHDEACLEVQAGTHAVFARNTDATENGGIDGALRLELSLNNQDESIEVAVDGELLDSIAYRATSPGIASQADSLGAICEATEPYGDGDLGTPGSHNPECR